MTAKRARYETSDVLRMLDSDFDDPMMEGSDDDFEDLCISPDVPDDENVSLAPGTSSTDSVATPRTPTEPESLLQTELSPLHLPPPSTISLTSSTAALHPFSTAAPPSAILSLSSTPSSTTISSTAASILSTSAIPPLSSTPVHTSTPKQKQHRINTGIPPKNWSTLLQPVTIQPYNLTAGPQFQVETSALEVFNHFFTNDLKTLIVQQSNLYALQCMGQHKFDEWEPITVAELSAYFGFTILMGVVDLPSLDDYWKTDEIFHYAPIASRITRQRFRDICRYLHFTDNTQLKGREEDGYDRLGKVRTIIEHIQDAFEDNYIPNCQQSIDEAMIPFQGRSTMKQYMPLKPVKRGFKVWVRADAVNGYFCQFDVYTGKSTGSLGELGLGGEVVKHLTQSLVGSFANVYFDNFFTSPKLLDALHKDGIYACGTVRTNRSGYPTDLNPKVQKLKERY